MTYKSRVTQMTVVPEGDLLFSACATIITVTDEGAGKFVEVRQPVVTEAGTIRINPEEWPTLQNAITAMLAECRETKAWEANAD